MTKVLVTYGVPDDGFEPLRAAGCEVIIPERLQVFTQKELLQLIPDCEAAVGVTTMDAEVVHAAKKLKLIATYGAGYDRIDIQAAAECGIPVTNIPQTVTQPTAEMAFALMISVCRRVGELNLRLHQEEPESIFGLGKTMGKSLEGMTLGIIGAGRIGSRMAQMAQAFGMRTIGYSRRGADPAIMEPADMDTVLRTSDVVSLHCPLTPETKGMIGREQIAMMKPGGILINTARGAVLDYDALCDALDTGHLFGAGLDVYPDEPHIPARLRGMKQAVLTPHMGCNTEQTRRIMAGACSRQILDALEGKRPEHIVNGL